MNRSLNHETFTCRSEMCMKVNTLEKWSIGTNLKQSKIFGTSKFIFRQLKHVLFVCSPHILALVIYRHLLGG